MAASEAKLKVLDSFHEGSEGQPTAQAKDGMNEYLNRYMHNVSVDEPESFPVKYTELGAIPKTTLQTLLSQPPKWVPLMQLQCSIKEDRIT